MRIAKLFAYLALAILLPLWLYNLSDNELTVAKEKQKTAEAEKKENEKLIAAIFANKQGHTEINFNSSHLDSLFYFIAKSNQNTRQGNQVTISPNSETESSLQDLIKISTANASAVQGLLSKERNINVSVSPIDINQKKVDSDATKQNDFPIYDFSEKGPFKFWKIKLSPKQISMEKMYFLVFNNISQTDTAYIYGITPAENWNNIDSFYLPKYAANIYPQNQFVVQYDFRNSGEKFYYVNGVFKGKNKKGKKRETLFKIPLIIGRDG